MITAFRGVVHTLVALIHNGHLGFSTFIYCIRVAGYGANSHFMGSDWHSNLVIRLQPQSGKGDTIRYYTSHTQTVLLQREEKPCKAC